MQTIEKVLAKNLHAGEESRRLFHGRGQVYPGLDDLLVDWFSPVVLVTLYRERPQEWLEALAHLLRERVPQAAAIVLQERFRSGAPSRVLYGELPDEVDAVERGLRYRLRLGKAQNIGFFPDMAVGRELVRRIAAGRRVLNLFAYTCSFSVAALAGGAEDVVNLDMSRGALELGRLNHRLNGLDLRRASFLPLELFRSFGRLRRIGPFDLVICDPPATQGRSFTAERDWSRLLRRLPEVLGRGGEVLLCRSAPHLSPDFLTQSCDALLPGAQLLGKCGAGPIFPEARPGRGLTLHHYRMP